LTTLKQNVSSQNNVMQVIFTPINLAADQHPTQNQKVKAESFSLTKLINHMKPRPLKS